MEAALLYLIFDIAAAFLSGITKNLTQNPLKCIVANRSALGTLWRRDCMVPVVAYIYRGTKPMATVALSIFVVSLQFPHIVLSTQHTGNDELMQWDAFHIQAVEIGTPQMGKKLAGTWNQIRNAATHTGIYRIIRTGADVDQFRLAVFCSLAIGNRTHTPFACCTYLHFLDIWETSSIGGYASKRMEFTWVARPNARNAVLL